VSLLLGAVLGSGSGEGGRGRGRERREREGRREQGEQRAGSVVWLSGVEGGVTFFGVGWEGVEGSVWECGRGGCEWVVR
jgi:hypothetical protein